MPHIFRDPVDINGFMFNDDVWRGDALYKLDMLSGWGDTAEPQVEVSAFGYSDGVVGADRFPKKEQYYEVGGYVLCRTRLAGEQAADILSTLIDVDDTLALTRYGPITKQALVRRVSKFELPQDVGEGFRWTVRMMAEWPFKISPGMKTVIAAAFSGSDWGWSYDNVVSFGRTYDVNLSRPYVLLAGTGNAALYPDLASVVNEGTADAYPITILHGPLPARTWSLVNETTGEVLTFDLELVDGVDMILDHREKTAFIGAEDVSYYIRGDWLHLEPGLNNLRLIVGSDSPNSKLTVNYYDTWRR